MYRSISQRGDSCIVTEVPANDAEAGRLRPSSGATIRKQMCIYIYIYILIDI